jgi:hypothetical protein
VFNVANQINNMGKLSGELVTEEGKRLIALQLVCLLDASHYMQYASKIIGVMFNVVECELNRELLQCLVAYNNLYHHICCEIFLELVL